MKALEQLSMILFIVYARLKGYVFSTVQSVSEKEEADALFRDEGYKLPAGLDREMERYRVHTVSFIARYKGRVVGTIGLADPKRINRPFDLLGIDEHGEHFEVQRLVVSKQHRNCSQLVLLGLFKEMYDYSGKHGVRSWISFGLRQLYVGLRRYTNKMSLVSVGSNFSRCQLSSYLYEHRIFDTCAVIRLDTLEPGEIFLRFLRQRPRPRV